jgi:hypothetical protein
MRGKWFAAKEIGLFAEAIRLANWSPCGALRWLIDGTGHDITSTDVWAAYAKPGVAC